MFTGIVTDLGKVRRVRRGDMVELTIATAFDSTAIAIGASIACSGPCLTVVAIEDGAFTVQASVETVSLRFVFDAPVALMPFIAPKGSVALDGVSLTVNEIAGTSFGVNIIPHTLACTSFREARPGQMMNLEIDMIARYVARLLAGAAPVITQSPAP